VTEYCEGKELFDIIVDKHYFPEEEAIYIFYEIVSAVRAMHANRIMHR
jgi:serine/threonine protein kinase